MSPAASAALFWAAAACCIVAQLALIWSAIRAPMSGSAEPAPVPMPSRASEVAWTVVPAVALAVLLVFTWRATHQAAAADPHANHHVSEGMRQVIEE